LALVPSLPSEPPLLDRRSPHSGRILFAEVALGVMMLVVIGLYVGLGTYASPMSDDFSHVASLRKIGLWNYVVKGYTSWYGIYSGWVWIGSLISVFDLFTLARWQPLFQVMFSLTAIFLFLSAFKQALSLSTRVWLTVLVQALWFAITEGLTTYFYWTTASMIYYGGNTLTVLQAACLARIFQARYAHTTGITVLLSLLVFISAGFAADVAIVQMLTYGGLAIAWKWHGSGAHSRRMTVIAGVALLGLGLVYLSPATQIRMQVESVAYGTRPQNVLVTLKIATRHGLLTAVKFFSKPVLYLGLLFMPLLARRVPAIQLRIRARLWHILAILIGVSCFYQALHGWSRGVELPERMIARAYWNMAALWSLFLVFFYRNDSLAKRIEEHWTYRKRYPILAACLLLNSNFLSLLDSYASGPKFTLQLEARHSYIASQKVAGNLELVVPALTVPQKLFPCSDVTGNRDHWVNKAVAECMGLKSIRAVRLSAEVDTDVLKIRGLAEAGNPEAEFMLAQLYDPRIPASDSNPSAFSESEPLKGTLPAKDPISAFQWYRRSACQGHISSRRVLVDLYLAGLGVQKSFGHAMRWYLISRVAWFGPGAGCS